MYSEVLRFSINPTHLFFSVPVVFLVEFPFENVTKVYGSML